MTYNFGEVRRITKEISLLIREELEQDSSDKPLPILGNKDYDPSVEGDTAYHHIPHWSFVDQMGDTITKNEMKVKFA